MQELVSILLIGVSLSMDTFSLSLSLGSIINKSKYLKLFPFVVGVFHFFMPMLGNKIGINIMQIFNLASNILLGLILIILGVNLTIQFFKKEEININLSLISVIFLAFSVSIDSFTIGLGISEITNKYLVACLIFCLCSFLFTLLGLIIGKYSNSILGRYASIIGILLLLLLGFYHIL